MYYYQSTYEQKRKRFLMRSLVVGGIFLVTFIGIKLYPIIHGPSIHITTLTNGQSFSDPMIRISGIAKYTKNLLINGSPIKTAPDGTFDEKLVLNQGYNVLNIQGVDRFGSERQQHYALMLKDSQVNLTMIPTDPAIIH